MKTLALVFLLSLSPIPGVFPERPRIAARVGTKHKTGVLYWVNADLEMM